MSLHPTSTSVLHIVPRDTEQPNMADAFLGLRMTVVMINPPVTVAGLITKVIPHQLLVLEQCECRRRFPCPRQHQVHVVQY